MSSSSTQLTVIIPAYNEAENIVANINELDTWLARNLCDLASEILVVDDGSTDGTGDVVETYASSHPRVRLAKHRGNFGHGRAIRTGFENARGDFVVCLDADLSYSPDHIPSLLSPLQRDEADITLASAYHPQGAVKNVPWARAFVSKWGNRILSVGTRGRFRTVTCMVRGYRREAIDTLELVNSGKDLHLEIIQKADLFGFRVKEVPAKLVWRDRKRRGLSGKKRVVDYIPFISISGTIVSHLVYTYVLRPGWLLLLPVLGLLLVSFIGGVLILQAFFGKLISAPAALSIGEVYVAFRETLLQGALTLELVFGSLVIALVFIAFYFASQQNKKNFEEMYILLNRMNQRIKRLEREH